MSPTAFMRAIRRLCGLQLDDRGPYVAQELVVQDGNLAPIRLRRGRCFGVHCRDRALDLIRARSPQAKGLLDEPYPFLDLGAIPLGPVLIPEQYQITIGAHACLAS